VRAETVNYEMLQGNIVAVGDAVEGEAFVVGRVVTFNKYHISGFEVEVSPGSKLLLDDIHSTDVRWSWPE